MEIAAGPGSRCNVQTRQLLLQGGRVGEEQVEGLKKMIVPFVICLSSGVGWGKILSFFFTRL